MTADELAAMIAEEIDNNSGTRAVLAKVQRGTATLADSERFTGITAEITGRLLADNVLSLPLSDRQGAFVDITAARYRDTFSVFSAVQRALDGRLGINLAVVDPGFEKARAQKAGHALADQTVPESTVQRRAESAGENIVRSQHDRIVQKQAEFRDRAGLQCSAIREGGAKCCEWCASVSGKYPASDTPQGFWGRHDNCKCSILYETRKGVQRLGGSAKKWEPLEDAGAPEPVRFTAEQAAEREAQHPVISFMPEQAAALQEKHQLKELTNDTERDRIIIREPILARRERNIGAFSELEMPMQKRTITRICKLYGIDISELRFKIQRDPHFLELKDDYFGSTDYDDIGRIDLFPKAFTNEEQLVRTILHEKLHVLQLKKHGKEYSLQNLNEMEKQARKYEDVMYTQLRKKVKR